jgi:phosphohistidine phosphatase
MDIYLIQHGESKPKEEDPARPLTDAGKRTSGRMAVLLGSLGISFDRVFHGGKLRAQQTAEILANQLKIRDRVEARTGLDPLDSVELAKNWLSEQAQRGVKAIAIVGHLPFLDKLASLLVTGNETAGIIAFQYAGVLRLAPRGQGEGYRVRWMLAAELLTT